MPRVLLIEDDKQASADIAAVLRGKGYETTPAFTGSEAAALLNEETYDLAIIDLILPDMNGEELCAMIRRDKRHKDMPIIVSTGISDNFTREQCEKLGANAFLTKPYRVDDLLEAVEKCVKK